MKTNSTVLALILAAGKGIRMNSSLPKPLIQIADRSIIQYIIDALRNCHTRIAIVIGHQADLIRSQLGNQYEYVLQIEQKGMAHAVAQAASLISRYEKSLIFVGDSPLIQKDSIRHLLQHHNETGAVCSFLTATFPIHFPYARVIRDEKGNVLRCVEERYATEDEKRIREYLTSHYMFNSDALLAHLNEIEVDPDTNEFYLTNIIGILVKQGLRVEAVHIHDFRQLVGLNTPEDLIWAKQILEELNG